MSSVVRDAELATALRSGAVDSAGRYRSETVYSAIESELALAAGSSATRPGPSAT